MKVDNLVLQAPTNDILNVLNYICEDVSVKNVDMAIVNSAAIYFPGWCLNWLK